jgi:hypothetical protein
MPHPATPLAALVGHGRVEVELCRLQVQQIGWLFGKIVLRVDSHHWRIGNDVEPLLLLPAIDKLMAGFPKPGLPSQSFRAR